MLRVSLGCLYVLGNWVGMQIILEEMAMLRDVFFPKGLPCFLGKLEWGARIPRKMVRACKIF